MAAAIITALLILPIAFVTAGFVASSTLLFAIASTTLRAQALTIRAIAIDLIVGAAFSIALFLRVHARPRRDAARLLLMGDLLAGFAVALTPANLLWGLAGHHARHRGRRAARHRAGAHRRAAAAGHLQPRSHRGADHVRRHLLRRDVRRIDDVDPAQHARRERDDRHRDRRPPDGAQRARRRGAGHRRDRIVRRRHARHARAQRHRAVDGEARARVWIRRVLRADGARLRDGDDDAGRRRG